MALETKIGEKEFDPKTQVKEYKRTCNECGKVWHSLTSREEQIQKEVQSNTTFQRSAACTCNHGAAIQAKRNVESQEDLLNKLKKCPECGSANYVEEINIYEKKY